MINVTGLWKNKGKDNKPYLVGYMGGVKVLIFPNGFKSKEEQPDYIMYFDTSKKTDDKNPEDNTEF